MGICSYHRDNLRSRLREQNADNETLYLNATGPYSEEELELFVECMAYLQLNVLDNPYSDILGEFFMQEITRGLNGQYFTPEHLCSFLSEMLNRHGKIEGKRFFDPACGSARMLLQAAKRNHKNYFYGADNSGTCAKMSVLNFFFNGLVGEVAWMDSLRMEWYGGWRINTDGVGIIPIEKEESAIWNEAPGQKPSVEPKEIENNTKLSSQQLTLF